MARSLKKFHAKLFKNLSNLLTNSRFYKQYCFETEDFSRNRKLSFQTVTLLILGLLKSSIKTELKSFYESIYKSDEVVNWVTDGAFCRARQKIKHQLFVSLYKFIFWFYYANIGGKRWFHYKLLGVDGSQINLPSSKALLKKYGCHHVNSIGTKIPQARVSFMCDILNYLTIDAQIEPFKVGEQDMFEQHLKHIRKGDLITADANYGHLRIMKLIKTRKADFCIRMSLVTTFVKEFLASGKLDAVLLWTPSKRTKYNCKNHKVDFLPMQIRLVRIELPNGKTEVLAVSLLDQNKYSYQDIKDLYEKRWGVEEEIKKYMQRMQIEFFSSLKVNGVLQDFYANIFMLNLVSLLTVPVFEQIYKSSEHCKYRYQINWTSAFGDVRKRLALLFLRGIKKIESIIHSLWRSFMKNIEPIKPGRAFPRDKRKKGSRQKAYINYKFSW